MEKNSKIYIAGHTGLVGSALLKALQNQGYNNLVFRPREELNLTNQAKTAEFFQQEKPEYVFLAAAKVGGIIANNTKPAEFIYENLQIQNNVMAEAFKNKVKKLMFFCPACIYPKNCPQPMKEEYLLTGPLEPTNEPFAIAKIAGLKMCQSYNRQYGTNFIVSLPANLYGPNDNFDLESGHVIPALIRKFHEAKTNGESQVMVWGSGSPVREFLYIDDLAEASIYLMNNFNPSVKQNEKGEIFLNVGAGGGTTIKELAETVKEVVDFRGEISWDSTKPDGMLKKTVDSSRLEQLGWRYKTNISEGIKLTYQWYIKKGG